MIRYGLILKTECGSNKLGIEAKIQKQENDKTSSFFFLRLSQEVFQSTIKRGDEKQKKAQKRER